MGHKQRAAIHTERPVDGDHCLALADAYREVIRGVPFSSIAQVYECVGPGTPEPRLGRSCLGLSLELGRLLRERGLGEVSYICAKRHVAVCCSHGGDSTCLLDPYLLHTEPVDLNVVRVRRRLEVSAYPLVDGRQRGCLALRLYSSGMLALAQYVHDEAAGRCRLRRHFKLSLEPVDERELPSPSEIAAQLFWSGQTTLSVRVVTGQFGLLELIHPVAAYHGSGRIAEDQLLICADDDRLVSYEERDPFEALLGTFCGELRLSRSEIIEHTLGGVQLYEQYAPAG